MRKLSSFIEGFVQYTDKTPSPKLFRWWSAVSLISSALERKVWTTPYADVFTYPNTYIILVGPPGAGKSAVTSQVQYFLRTLKDHKISKASLTKAALMDDLKDAHRGIVLPGKTPPFIEFNFLSIISNELQVLIPAYDAEFMGALTDIWDGHGYSERRRSTKLEIDLPNAQFNLLAGTTPIYLAGTLPPGAWDGGFLSRTIIVFSGEQIIRPLFSTSVLDAKLKADLTTDIERISKLYGRMTFTDEAAKLIGDWHNAGGPPQPEHPRLMSYNARRTAHLLKLCMIVSVSRSDELKISEEDFVIAHDMMLATEDQMPEIFKAMNTGGDQRAIEELWYFCMSTYQREKKPLQESRLLMFLSEKLPAYSVEKVLNIMVKTGILEQVDVAPPSYKPRPKRV